jgi:two-component system, chemotaxis family, chemotaxis protein CheY
MRMLIVDDSRTMRNFLAALAADLNFEATHAADGHEALSQLNSNDTFDVALIDWDMPRMDGISLLNSIRQHPEYDPMKIMMVTSRHDMESVCAAIQKGADDFLMKPVNGEMLSDKLKILGLVE